MKKNYSILKYVVMFLLATFVTSFAYLLLPLSTVNENITQVPEESANSTSATSRVGGSTNDTFVVETSYWWWNAHPVKEIVILVAVFVALALYTNRLTLDWLQIASLFVGVVLLSYNAYKRLNATLLQSARRGHLACVKFLVRQGANIHDKNAYGSTALLLSAQEGKLDCVKYLVQQGANIHARNNYGTTALLWIAQEGDLDCLQFLRQQGANINDKNYFGSTALQCAKEKRKHDVVNYLSNF